MAIDNPVVPEVPVGVAVETIEVRPSPLRRISWGAIIAGVVVALVAQIALSLLGIAIGVSTMDPMSLQDKVPEALSTGTGIWWVVSGLIALFVGGLVAGRLAGIPRRSDGALHGLITHSVTTLFSLLLLTTAMGVLVSGAWSVVQSGMVPSGPEATSTMGPLGAQGARGSELDRLRQDAQGTSRQHPSDVVGQAGSDAPTKQDMVVLAQRTKRAIVSAAVWSFVALVFGAAAAAIGGMAGSNAKALRGGLLRP